MNPGCIQKKKTLKKECTSRSIPTELTTFVIKGDNIYVEDHIHVLAILQNLIKYALC